MAARVVVLDDRDRILLFRGTEKGGPRSTVWYVPGGGVEDGESMEDAARREFWEETGEHVELGPCVWTRRRLRDNGVDSRSHFFLARCGAFDFDPAAAPVPGEVHEYRWWALDEIAAAGPETFIPKRLAELLVPLLNGEVPLEPVDASDAPVESPRGDRPGRHRR
jgi:8-oxo-dGTP pyrophosphatase MutT (NUDIX family)